MHIPVATYRLQFSPSFRFADARALVGYLARLGISDVYASPVLKATAGSTHGYDVTSPHELNPELGTLQEFEALMTEVRACQMYWLQDIVPNHMAYSRENRMLMDVFESGRHSRFYNYFDVFRDHPDPELRSRVLAPFLASPLEEVLRRGEIRPALDEGGLAIRYFDWRFPLALKSYDFVLRWDIERLEESVGSGDDRPRGLMDLCDVFARLSETDDSPQRRTRLAAARRVLTRLYEQDSAVRSHIDAVLESFGRPLEGPVEDSPLFALLQQQVFKLVYWQTAHETINYRRFFYLSDFISLRTEDPVVFRETHGKIIELTRTGCFTGLRIDHVDGLYHPRSYLSHLRNSLPGVYLVVEKILELEEALPAGWPVQGTSGYKFCNYVNGIFCRQESEESFTRIYREFIGAELDYARLLYAEKKKILEQRMAGEVEYLAHLCMQVSPDDGSQTAESVQKALTAIMAAFPVYRTYIDAHYFTERDRTFLGKAIEQAREKVPDCHRQIDRIGNLLLSDPHNGKDPRTQEARRHFLMRFQQFTGPATAKGVEDTLLYVYNRFVSLNEVGGDPNEFGVSCDRFHRFCQARSRHWPHAMNATSTHDSKRGEDVRARLNVLSEIPERWEQAVTRWAAMNQCHKQQYGEILAPHRNDEYLLYQTLVGAWPFDAETQDLVPLRQRIGDYMVKAVREAKVHSNWVEPDERYENACRCFVDAILDHSGENPFWTDFLPFQKEVAEYAIYNSLSQTTLKMTCPGLPDFYQGAELWNFNLVDPDNRRPVDFEERMHFLAEIQEAPPDTRDQLLHTLLSERRDGRIKLFLIWKGLHARRENRELFEAGDYTPASVLGDRAQHVIAFFRTRRDRHALTVAPRFPTSLVRPGEVPIGGNVWGNTRISLPSGAPSNWHDAITDRKLCARGEISVGDILSGFPVSVLMSR